jgi:hypothetical protein
MIDALVFKAAFPFVENFLDIARDEFGIDVKRRLAKTLPSFWRNALLYGIPNALGVDMSGSMQTSLPFTDLDEIENGRDMFLYLAQQAAGIPGRLMQDVFDVAKGNVSPVELMPNFLLNPTKGIMGSVDRVRTRRGRTVFDKEGKPERYSVSEAIERMAGFQPSRTINASRARWDYRQMVKAWNGKKRAIYADLRKAYEEGDREGVKEAILALKELMREAKKAGILKYVTPVSESGVKRALRDAPKKKEISFLRDVL